MIAGLFSDCSGYTYAVLSPEGRGRAPATAAFRCHVQSARNVRIAHSRAEHHARISRGRVRGCHALGLLRKERSWKGSNSLPRACGASCRRFWHWSGAHHQEVYSSLTIGVFTGMVIYQFSLNGAGFEQLVDSFPWCRR